MSVTSRVRTALRGTFSRAQVFEKRVGTACIELVRGPLANTVQLLELGPARPGVGVVESLQPLEPGPLSAPRSQPGGTDRGGHRPGLSTRPAASCASMRCPVCCLVLSLTHVRGTMPRTAVPASPVPARRRVQASALRRSFRARGKRFTTPPDARMFGVALRRRAADPGAFPETPPGGAVQLLQRGHQAGQAWLQQCMKAPGKAVTRWATCATIKGLRRQRGRRRSTMKMRMVHCRPTGRRPAFWPAWPT